MKNLKEKNYQKSRWLGFVFAGVVLVVVLVAFWVAWPYWHKTQAPDSTNSPLDYAEQAKNALDANDYPTAVENYEKAIEANPANTENYVDKSAAEYAAGDLEAAKATVEEGLIQDPTNELLKSRLDALDKGTFDDNVGAERQ